LAEKAAADAAAFSRQKEARRRAEMLKPRLALLTVVVSSAVGTLPGLEIRQNGVPLDRSRWGTPLPVDRGRHVIVVTAPGKQQWERAVDISQDGVRESVEIVALADVSGGASAALTLRPQPTPPQTSTFGPVATLTPDTTSSPSNTQRTLGLSLGGGGVAGLIAGTVSGIVAITKKNASNADGHCRADNVCDQVGVSLREEAQTAGTVSTVMFIVGGAVLVGGFVVFATAPPATPVRADITVGPMSASIRGSW